MSLEYVLCLYTLPYLGSHQFRWRGKYLGGLWLENPSFVAFLFFAIEMKEHWKGFCVGEVWCICMVLTNCIFLLFQASRNHVSPKAEADKSSDHNNHLQYLDLQWPPGPTCTIILKVTVLQVRDSGSTLVPFHDPELIFKTPSFLVHFLKSRA